MTATLVLADNQPIALRGLRALLAQDFDVIGETTDGLETVKVVESEQPDVLVLDLEMPGLIGFEVAKRVRRVSPHTHIVIYSGHGAWPYIQRAFEECEVMAYVHKDDDDECIVDALSRVLSGERYLSPTVMNVPRDQTTSDLDVYLRLYDNLTDTEKELLHPLAEGYTAAQIAELRVVEESTIRTHIEHMKDKLNLSGERMSLDTLRRVARLCMTLGNRSLL
ncbi:MAG: response regulator transcription factor [Anaerolineae bacterium]